MSIWSRLGGALAALGGPVGALLQTLAGQSASRGDDGQGEHYGIAFTIGMIALGAKMAKADGVVTDDEIAAFQQVVHIPEGELRNVSRIFDLAKQDVAGFDVYARQLASLFADKPEMLEDVLEGLFHIAKADGLIHPGELAYLESVAEIFGFSERAFEGIKTRHIMPRDGDPYVIMGIDRSFSNEQIKNAYRRLVRENHPDALVSRGVPAEFITIATEKTARINEAYGRISRERGL